MNKYTIAFLATLALGAGCDKKTGEANAAPKTDKTAPATPDKAAVSPPKEQFKPPAETVEKTNALDLELVTRGTAYVVRDDAYEVSFPGKPTVDSADGATPTGGKLKTASAMFATNNDVYGFLVIPIPKDVDYDVKKGMDGARDGALANVNGKIIREEDTMIGTLKARHTVGEANFQGQKLTLELFIAWDEGHRTLVAAFTATDKAQATQADKDFIASFKVNPSGKAPPALITH